MALRVGYEKLNARDGLGAEGLVGGGRPAHDPVVRRASRPLARPGRLADAPRRRDAMSRVLVTGGGGFLGSHLVERLESGGHDVFVGAPPRLRPDAVRGHRAAVRRRGSPSSCSTSRPRSAASARTASNPGRYWYANLMMGAHVLELARVHATRKVVIAGTVCAYPKFTPVPFSEDDLWNGYPEETNAPYGVAKKSVLVGAAGLPRAVRARRDLPAAREPLRAARQLRPRLVARDPGADPEDGRRRRRGRALGRRLADARVPLRRRLRRGPAARRRALRRRRSR